MNKKELLTKYPELCKRIFEDGYGAWNKPGTVVCPHYVFHDYLKEQLQPDWEILEFRATTDYVIPILTLRNGVYEDARLINRSNSKYDLNQLLYGEHSVEDGVYIIHKVRKANGEILTVDGKGKTDGKTVTILSFKIDGKYMLVYYRSNTRGLDCWCDLDEVTKLQPLFVTEDGVEIYEEEKTIAVNKNTFLIDISRYNEGVGFASLYFSTREAAEKWVAENKPSVSIAKLRELGVSEDIIEKL